MIDCLEEYDVALRKGAACTMQEDPDGPRYVIVKFQPPKPAAAQAFDYKFPSPAWFVESTYCIEMRADAHRISFILIELDFIYSDRIGVKLE